MTSINEYWNQCETALNLHHAGLSLEKIGNHLNVSPTKACAMIVYAKRRPRRQPDDLNELSFRAKNCLITHGYDDKEKILKGIRNGKIYPRKLPNYGEKTHLEVCDWLGIDVEHTAPEKTISRYIAFLQKRGYQVTKTNKEGTAINGIHQ